VIAERIVVRFGHPTGGWIPWTDPKYTPAPDAFVQTADRLGMQPPYGILPFPDRALYGLRLVEVAGHGRYWCFTSQSIGTARQLRAGGCDFVFAPAEECEPGRLWWSCTSSSGNAPPEPALAGHVENVLHQMIEGYPYIPVEGEPAFVARVIGHALDVLPPEEVAARTWWSCLLWPDHMGELGVSGRWPSDFPQDDATLFERLFEAPPAAPAAEPLERQAQAVARLAHVAVRGTAGPWRRPHPGATSLRDQLGAVVEYDLDITADDVPRIYADDEQYVRLDAVPGVVGDYAAACPGDAWRLLMSVLRTTPITRAMLEGISRAQSGSRDRLWSAGNSSTEAVDRLAEALCRAFPPGPGEAGLDDRADAVRRFFMVKEGGLHRRPDLEDAHAFLTRITLTRKRYPDLFPPRSRMAADKLRTGTWRQAELVTELHVHGWAGPPSDGGGMSKETLRVARELDRNDVEPIAALLGAMIDPAQDEQVQLLPDGYLDTLCDAVGVHDATDEDDDRVRDDWIVTVAESCPSGVRKVVVGALLTQITEDGGTPSPRLLVLALRMMAAEHAVFTAATSRMVAGRAAESLTPEAAPGNTDGPASGESVETGKLRRLVMGFGARSKAAPAEPAERGPVSEHRPEQPGKRQRQRSSTASGLRERRSPAEGERVVAWASARSEQHEQAGVRDAAPRARKTSLPEIDGTRTGPAESGGTGDRLMTVAIVVAAALLVVFLLAAVALMVM
jgi:hypothetical protein